MISVTGLADKQSLGYGQQPSNRSRSVVDVSHLSGLSQISNEEPVQRYSDGGLPYLNSSNSASDNYAQLSRAQYNDWLQNTFPVYGQLLDLSRSESFIDDAANETREGLMAANKVASAQQERDLRKYGLSETPRQREDRLATTKNKQGAALNSAVNRSIMEAHDAQNTILAGGLGSVHSITEDN